MQGHVPGSPQPHFPQGLAPFVGYLATREPGPRGGQVPPEPAWVDEREGNTELDQFADVGNWEPMHRPLIRVIAVLLSISLLIAGMGTLLELLLTSR